MSDNVGYFDDDEEDLIPNDLLPHQQTKSNIKLKYLYENREEWCKKNR